jgi:hypothetical protein
MLLLPHMLLLLTHMLLLLPHMLLLPHAPPALPCCAALCCHVQEKLECDPYLLARIDGVRVEACRKALYRWAGGVVARGLSGGRGAGGVRVRVGWECGHPHSSECFGGLRY